MDVTIHPGASLQGRLTVPADKAICHRLALACAISTGTAEISPWSTAADCRYTVDALQQLGARIEPVRDGLRIDGVGLSGLRPPDAPVSCGESGTTMRLLSGVLAGQPFTTELVGSPSLNRRPMRRIVEPLTRMGAQIRGAGGTDEVVPPLTITGRRPLAGMTYPIPVASAQVKSAILFAGLFSDRPVTVVEPAATRDHTERLLLRLGASLHQDGRAITLEPVFRDLRAPAQFQVPADLSGAAFFIVAATIAPGSRLTLDAVGLNPSRTHVLDVLRRMGASIQARPDQAWEPRGEVAVEHRRLRAVTVAPEEVPLLIDELPALMVAAATAEGTSRFDGLAELRVKETDRLQSMLEGLSRMGARIARVGAQGLAITGRPLRGAEVDSFGDHRTAMSLAVAGLVANSPTRIRGAECVSKSFAEFFPMLAQVTSQTSVSLK